MVYANYQKPVKGSLNILVMRSRGGVIKFSISTNIIYTIIIGFLLSLLFLVASVVGMHRYATLYVQHEKMQIEEHKLKMELAQLRSKIEYENSKKTDSYASLLQAMSGTENNPAEPVGAETKKVSIANNSMAAGEIEKIAPEEQLESGLQSVTQEGGTSDTETSEQPQVIGSENEAKALQTDPLSAWAGLFPEPSLTPEQELSVEDFQAVGPKFQFSLVNTGRERRPYQGHMLLAFQVSTGGINKIMTFPEFDINSSEPEFSKGQRYNIRSNKFVQGRLKVPPGAQIKEMMIVIQAQSGNIVLKKKLIPKE